MNQRICEVCRFVETPPQETQALYGVRIGPGLVLETPEDPSGQWVCLACTVKVLASAFFELERLGSLIEDMEAKIPAIQDPVETYRRGL